jgi:hypothetical protein
MRSRHRAALLHLAISVAIVALLLVPALVAWYPAPLREALGAMGLAAITLGVQAALGPVLTWIVLTPNKPARLVRLDLAVIACAQLAALGYAAYVIAQARPVFVVFVRDRFEIATASDMRPDELARAPARFRVLSWDGPRLAAAELPTDPSERLQLVFSALAGADVKTYPRYFVPYESQAWLVREVAAPIARLRERHPEAAAALASAVRATDLPESQLGFVPLRGRKRDFAVLVERASARIVGYVRVDPW